MKNKYQNHALSATPKQHDTNFSIITRLFATSAPKIRTLTLRALFLICGLLVLTGSFAMTNRAQTSIDGFDPDASGTVLAVAVAADGKIYVAGQINSIGGQPVGKIARLNVNGTLDTSFSATLNNSVYAVALQTDGKILVGGNFTTVNGVSRSFFARLNTDGSLDTSFAATANGSVYAITPRLINENILVGGDFTTMNGSARQRLARLDPSGTLDAGFSPSFNGTVSSVKQLADGHILVSGSFFQVNGQSRFYFARLNNSGTFDTSFNLNADDTVDIMAIQADRKILIGGFFSSILGASRTHLARLNADGTLDTGFNPSLDGSVDSITTQPDGKILINGYFDNVNGQSRARLARLNQDGTLDTGFSVSFNSYLETVAVQPNGSILVGGNFSSAGGQTRNRIARFDQNGNLDKDLETVVTGDVRAIAFGADKKMTIAGDFLEVDGQPRNRIAKITPAGQLDPTYNPDSNGIIKGVLAEKSGSALIVGGFTSVGGLPRSGISKLKPDGTSDPDFSANTNLPVNAITKQPDGKYIIGGEFTQVGTQPINRLARLNPNGSVDTSFNPNINAKVNTVKKQLDGKIIIAGEFTMVGMTPAQRIARLNANGSVDATFSPSINGPVKTVTIQPNGKILAGGTFTDVSGVTRNNIVRLNDNGSVDTSYNPIIDDSVEVIAVNSEGETTVGGDFGNVNGQIEIKIVYLNQDGTTSTRSIPPRIANTLYATASQDAKKNFGSSSSSTNTERTLDRSAATQGLGELRANRLEDEVEYVTSGSLPFKPTVTAETSTDNGITWVPRGEASAVVVGNSFVGTESSAGETEPTGVKYTFAGFNLPIEQNVLVRFSGTDPDSGSYDEQIFSTFIEAPTTQAQTITVTTAAPTAAYVGSKFNVAATASSGLPVTITTAGNCSVFSGGTNGSATILMGGASTNCTVNYNQAGDSSFDPAPTISSSSAAASCPVISTPTLTSRTRPAGGTLPITIPVDTSALLNTTSPSIFAATLTFTFDPAVLQFVSTMPGAAAPTATVQSNQISPGTVRVSLSSTSALNGTGSLVNFNFNVIGGVGSLTPLTVTSFQFNEANTLAVCSTIAPAGALTIVSGTITGNVNYANGAGQPSSIPGVAITANGSPVVSGISDAQGNYSLSGFGAGAYIVTPSKARQVDPNNGFTSLDASLVAQHVVGITTLTGNQAIAADVTEDGTISSLDAAFIAQFIVGITNSSNQTGIWRFNPASTTPDITVDSVQNYAANLLGDVNGSWSSTGASLHKTVVSDDPASSSVASSKVRAGSTVTVPFRIDNLKGQGVTSYQFEIKYDPKIVAPAEIAADKSGTLSENMQVFSNAPVPGQLKVVVFNALPVTGDGVYLNLRFRAIGSPGSATPLAIQRLLINDGETAADVTDGQLTLAPAANKGVINGTVLTAFGTGISDARVVLTSTTGEQLFAGTSLSGQFRFTDLVVGETYIISVSSKRYRFTPQSVGITENPAILQLIAQE